jgi:hypothetical protein
LEEGQEWAFEEFDDGMDEKVEAVVEEVVWEEAAGKTARDAISEVASP